MHSRAGLIALVLTAIACDSTSGAEPINRDSCAQQCAQARADWMVQHRRRWHPPFRIGHVWCHARFEGVGWGGPSRLRLGTCRPRRRGMRLIGDAVARGRRMTARVRLWR